MSISPRFVVAFLAFVSLSLSNTCANAGGAFAGETIIHVGDGGHEAWLIGKSQDVGYKYSYVAFLWVDLWSWGGTYCVYQCFETKYWPVKPEEAARLLGKKESELETPFWYRYPLGLFIFGPIFLIGAIGWVVQERAKQSVEDAAKLSKELQYTSRHGRPNRCRMHCPCPLRRSYVWHHLGTLATTRRFGILPTLMRATSWRLAASMIDTSSLSTLLTQQYLPSGLNVSQAGPFPVRTLPTIFLLAVS